MVRRTKAVALIIEGSDSDARSLLTGIASYIHENERWSIYHTDPNRDDGVTTWLETWHGDGILARVEKESIAGLVQGLDIPVVDISCARQFPEVPSVGLNEDVVGKIASFPGSCLGARTKVNEPGT